LSVAVGLPKSVSRGSSRIERDYHGERTAAVDRAARQSGHPQSGHEYLSLLDGDDSAFNVVAGQREETGVA
jgi:hypothetical protein